MTSIAKKIRLWHLMPLALIALIVVAVFVWVGRGSFSTRDIELSIEGPVQIESGQTEIFTLNIKNNSQRLLEDLHIFVEFSDFLSLQDGETFFSENIANIKPGSSYSKELRFVATSAESKEQIRARFDYSPQGIEARFVNLASHEVVVGSLDVSVIFDVPRVTYPNAEIKGTIYILPNIDIEGAPIYLRLLISDNFELGGLSQDFDYDTVWKLGSLTKDNSIKREFVGRIGDGAESIEFVVELGKFDGITFIPLKIISRSAELSSSPVILESSLIKPSTGYVFSQDELQVRVSYVNQSDSALEGLTIETLITPDEIIDFSSFKLEGVPINVSGGKITWDEKLDPIFSFVDVGDTRSFSFSFKIMSDIESSGTLVSDKIIKLTTSLSADGGNILSDGGVARAIDTLNIKIATTLELNQTVRRQGGAFSNSGPIPPSVGELTTYNVKWSITNTLNETRSIRVEAVLPEFAIWQNMTQPLSEDIKYIEATSTVLWDLGTLPGGVGSIYPAQSVEFQIGIVPLEQHRGSIINILESTKLTGVDTFTDHFIEQDIGEVRTILPDDDSVDMSGAIVQ